MLENPLMDEEKTNSLIALAQKGDVQASEKLLYEYNYIVRSCIRNYFVLDGEKEDLVQEGMLGLFRAINTYRTDNEEGKSFKNFARMCISHRIIDAVKASSSLKNAPLNNYVPLFQTENFVASNNPEEEIIRREEQMELQNKLKNVLSDFEFKVLEMYMEGYSYSEICEDTKKDSKSVDNAVQRGRRKLCKLWKNINKK